MLGNIGVMLHTGDMPMEEISRYAQAADWERWHGSMPPESVASRESCVFYAQSCQMLLANRPAF